MKKQRKTILIIAPYGFNDRMSSFIEFVSARLLASHDWRVTALVQSENGRSSHETLYGITIRRYTSVWHGLRLAMGLFFNPPAVVHVHNLRNNRVGIITGMLARLCGSTLVFTEYGLLHDHYLVADRDNPFPVTLNSTGIVRSLADLWHKPGTVSTKLKNYLFHWSLTHAHHIVFVSRHNLPLAQTLGLQNYRYLPQILDTTRWETKTASTDAVVDGHVTKIRSWLAETTQPFALFVGQLKLRKGWDTYIKAAAHIPANVLPWFVVVSSTANEEPAFFTELVERLKVRDRIVFLGKVFDSALLQAIYAKSAVVIVPSRYEGFGLVPTEAFAAQRPLIAADVAALNEFICDGENGLLFPAEDATALATCIQRVMEDENIRNRIINSGTHTLAKLQSPQRQRQWLDFYASLITGRNDTR